MCLMRLLRNRASAKVDIICETIVAVIHFFRPLSIFFAYYSPCCIYMYNNELRIYSYIVIMWFLFKIKDCPTPVEQSSDKRVYGRAPWPVKSLWL